MKLNTNTSTVRSAPPRTALAALAAAILSSLIPHPSSLHAAEYTLKGERWLRMYTADRSTPVYNARIDAARIVNGFCNVPWTKSNVASAHETSHSSTNLDANVANREAFDAALFCANHAESMHVAYANASCYRIDLGSGTLPNLTSLAVNVYSDPYNAGGARIVLMTDDTGVIPTDCSTVRGDVAGGIRATNVARRVTVTSGGKDYWYPSSTNLVFGTQQLGASGIPLRRYLYVFVLLEDYGTTRGDWLEGSAFIDNEIRIVTSAAIEGLPAVANDMLRMALVCNEDCHRDFNHKVIVEQYPAEDPIASVTPRGTETNAFVMATPVRSWKLRAPNGSQYEFVADLPDAKSGISRFTAYLDVNGNGAFDPGEPYGFARDVDPSSGVCAEIEMRSTHPVFGRIDITDAASNDRDAVFGSYSSNMTATNSLPYRFGRMAHVRVDRYAVNGITLGTDFETQILLGHHRIELDRWLDLKTSRMISEKDILYGEIHDIEWNTMNELIDDAAVLGRFGGEVIGVSYRIVVDDSDFVHPIFTNSVLSAVFTRSFDQTNQRKIPDSLTTATPLDGDIRLAWSLGANDTYTAARIQVATVSGSTTNTVHEGTAFLANVRRRIGSKLYYTARPPATLTSGNYVWRVTALNAKFKTDAFSPYAPLVIP